MVNAQFFTNKEAGSIAMKLTGHAGAAKQGEDLVCASASILTYTVAQALQFMYEEGKLKKKPKLKLEPGDSLVVANPRSEDYAEALHIFFVAQVGFHLLSHNYPQYVSLSSFGESEHK